MNLRRTIAEADLKTLNVAAFCRDHGISRDRFYAIRRAHRDHGEAGLEPKSRAPRRVANRTSPQVEDLIVALRKDLTDLGVDAGAATIRFHLASRLPAGERLPSESTIWRVLHRRGFIVADPSKRPKRASRSFSAERANECWQIDSTDWALADGSPVKIINVIDDCTRVCIASIAAASCTGADAFDAMASGAARWGWPERFLSDNAKAFRAILAPALAELGISAGHSRPYHPQTCGKVERFHQTLKKFLTAQAPAATLSELQAHLDRFRDYYNHQRPHRSLGRAIPAQVWAQTPKNGPADHPITGPPRVTTNKITGGTVRCSPTLAIAVPAAYNGQHATTIVTGTRAHVFVDGRLIRALTIDPTRQRQPLYGRPGRPTHQPNT